MKVMTNTVGYSCTDLNKMTVTFLLMTTDCLLILLTFTPHVKRDLFCYTKWTCAAHERKIFTCRKRSRAPLNFYPSTRAAMTLFFFQSISQTWREARDILVKRRQCVNESLPVGWAVPIVFGNF